MVKWLSKNCYFWKSLLWGFKQLAGVHFLNFCFRKLSPRKRNIKKFFEKKRKKTHIPIVGSLKFLPLSKTRLSCAGTWPPVNWSNMYEWKTFKSSYGSTVPLKEALKPLAQGSSASSIIKAPVRMTWKQNRVVFFFLSWFF